MLTLKWRPEADADVEAIFTYIAQRNLAAATRLRNAIQACAERLPQHPYMYRRGRRADTREAVVHPNYILIYRDGIDAVEVLNVIHSRRQYPPGDEG